jgi:hypothetical protein
MDVFKSKTLFLSNYDRSYPKILEESMVKYKINFKKIG